MYHSVSVVTISLGFNRLEFRVQEYTVLYNGESKPPMVNEVHSLLPTWTVTSCDSLIFYDTIHTSVLNFY